ncbi:MAG: 50S ribosomal protein L4 [Planctomycetia bacterium]|nr:50S ribosomal protein L4 [Planctomycetia bacterium]
MPKISVPVINRDGAEVGKVEIDPAAFGGKVNRQLIQEVVLMHLANQRAGTHSTLRRGEVAGSTKKLFRQKGTGNARVGTRRTNKRRGGGTAKGPKPRDYEYHLPKKAVRAATRMAILSKFIDNEAVILDDWKVDKVKTKPVATVFQTLTKKYSPVVEAKPEPTPTESTESSAKPAKKKRPRFTWLVGTADYDKNLHLSARNLEDVEVLPAREFNCYTVLKQKRLILTRAALEVLLNPNPAKS